MHKAKRERVMQGAKGGQTGKVGVIAAVTRKNSRQSSKVLAKVLNSPKRQATGPHGRVDCRGRQQRLYRYRDPL